MALAAGRIFYKKAQERFLYLEAQNNFFPALQQFTFPRPLFFFQLKTADSTKVVIYCPKKWHFLSAFYLIHESHSSADCDFTLHS